MFDEKSKIEDSLKNINNAKIGIDSANTIHKDIYINVNHISKDSQDNKIANSYLNTDYIRNILNEITKDKPKSIDLQEIVRKAEETLIKSGEYNKYHKILEEFEESNKDNIKDIAKYYYLKASKYYDEGKCEEAIKFIKKSVTIDENNSEYLNTYADYLNDSDKYTKAIVYYQKALSIDLKIFGKNNKKILNYYLKLSSTYNINCQYKEAIEFMQKVLDIDLKISGKNNNKIALNYNTIGDMYINDSDYEKAIESYEEALGIFKDLYQDENNNNIKITKEKLNIAKEKSLQLKE